MKYLNDFKQDKQTAIFNKFADFFAFSQDQLNEKKKDGIRYASLGSGLIAPIYEAANLIQALNTTHKEAIQLDIAENGIKAIIHRELANYECQITCDYSDALDVLIDYGITEKQVETEWPIFWQNCVDNDYF